ncbi:hypothetical protein AC1031_019820 [Aphanomyces cochlioides]|nr:hypothetical protein AC1031_019820 [Aphanomyces cochlioides]
MTVAEELLRRTVVSADLEQSLVKTARNHAATMLREVPKDAGRAPELVERVHNGNVHVVKASVALPAASPADVLAMFHTSTTARYQEFMVRLFGDVVLDGLVIHDRTLSVTETLTLHWLAFHSSTDRPRDYVYAQYTAQVQSHVVCVWESIELSPWVPLAGADRKSIAILASASPSRAASVQRQRRRHHGGALSPCQETIQNRDATDAFEADMRDVGRDAINALLETQALPFLPSAAPSSLKLATGVVLSETAPMPRVFTIKAVIQLPRFNLLDVMALLDMRSTALFRDTMQTLLTSDFVDGVVLHAVPPMPHSAESLTINWLALHNAKAHLPPRDYVFLKYGDCIRRRSRDSVAPTKAQDDVDYDDMIGISAWESVDLPNWAELPESLHVLRMVFRRCGYIVEPTSAGLSVSFFISYVHQTRSTVSSMTKTWLQRLATSVALLRDAVVMRFFAEQKLHSDPRAVVAAARDNDHCVVCSKRFTLLRRKSHCMVCGSVVCKACMEGTQGSGNNRLRACVACCAPSKVCLRKYWAADMTASAASSTSESSES